MTAVKPISWPFLILVLVPGCVWRMQEVRVAVPAIPEERMPEPELAPPKRELLPPARFDIDWGFIARLEGGRRNAAYVPARRGVALDNSGVTVASGFDLGQHDAKELLRMGVDERLVAKLTPYFRRRGGSAQRMLEAYPLVLDGAEIAALDHAKRADTVRKIAAAFDRGKAPHTPTFAALTRSQQSVIASVATQYGTRLDKKTPRFWAHLLSGRFASARDELRNFRDGYPTRRNCEADFLERSL